MEESRFVLAVDGGGSKTRAELRDETGRALAHAAAGPCNLYRDAAAGLNAIDQVWRQCCAQAGLDPAAAAGRTVLSAALAGVGATQGRARFRADTGAYVRADLSSDAYAALVGAFDAGPGILLSIGTGTVACRRSADGQFTQIGGWGFPVGDAGGGAWLGLRAVAAWLEHRDGVRDSAPGDEALWQAVERHVGVARASILAWLRQATPATYAALAPAVLSAQDGSPLAGAVLDDAATHLARLVQALRSDPRLAVALGGGLAAPLAPRIAARLGHGFAPATASPLQGAWLIATGRAAPETFVETN